MPAGADETLAGDHALVVGISRYPRLAAEGVAANLEGPDNDAEAVCNWLADPQGGRLPPENVLLVRSADLAAGATDPQPTCYAIQQKLEEIRAKTSKRRGRRLYLFFAGHGFSPELEEAALFTAEASRSTPMHVYAHAWLRWFRRAQRFEQSVLWVDACMNYEQTVPVQTVPIREELGTGVPGPAFIGVAAQTKSALELPMRDGQVHGVFTWTLLKGLEGAAANRRGRVTGESLRNFLHNAMADFLPAEAKKAASVDLQPFIRADEGIEFVRLESRPVCPVSLSIPAASAGQQLRIWSGAPHRQIVGEALDGPAWSGQLVRGLYVADVPDAGLRQGFQVTGVGDVDAGIVANGPPVTVCDGSTLLTLDVQVTNPATSVVVVDDEFQRVVTATGRLTDREAPGVYKVRTQFGRDMTTATDEIVLLDSDLVVGAAPPALSSPALAGVAAQPAGTPAGGAEAGSGISVVGRYWTGGRGAERAGLPHPLAGLQLVDDKDQIAGDLAADSTVADGQAEPVAGWHRALDPGFYRLRQTLADGRVYEGSVVVCDGWLTKVVVRRIPGLGGGWRAAGTSTDGPVDADDVAIFMHRSGTTAVPERDEVIEAARLALVQGGDVFGGGRGSDLRRALLEEYDEPIAALIGCHLLLRAMAGPTGTQTDRGAVFDRAVERLRSLLGSGRDEHPDVHALSLQCTTERLRAAGPVAAPPMFADSWRLLVNASYDRPDLLPPAMWEQVHASIRKGPFFVWAVDDATKGAHAQQLARWLHRAETVGSGPPTDGTDVPLPPTIRDAGRQLRIPAAALAGLWEGRTGRP